MKKYEQYLNSEEWEFIPYDSKSMADGGIMDYEDNINPSVEVEGGEVGQMNNGLIDQFTGASHKNGGIKMNLDSGTKIFSEKLKHPEMKKSFAKLAKKFETKKDIENLENPISDNINKSTSELNISLKNKLSDDLFQEQEDMKLAGKFGTSIKKQTMKDYGLHKMPNGELMPDSEMMRWGGLMKAKEGDIVKNENGVFIEGKKGKLTPIKNDYTQQKFKTPQGRITPTQKDLNAPPPANWNKFLAQSIGFGYTPDPNRQDYTAELQEFAYDDALDKAEAGDKQALEALKGMWKSYKNTNYGEKNYPNYSKKDFNNLSLQDLKDLRGAYIDDLRGKRVFSLNSQNPPAPKPPLTGDTVDNLGIKKLEGQQNTRGFGNLNLNFQIPDTYPRDPIWTKNLSPEYVTPERIVPYYNDIVRGNRSIQQNVGSRTGSDIANLIQSQGLANEQIGKRFYDANIYNTQTANQFKQFNANAKMNTDQTNLGQFNRFLDNIASREGVIQGQKKYDDNANIQRMFDKSAYDERKDYISDTFFPSQYGKDQLFNGTANSTTNYNNMTDAELERLYKIKRLQEKKMGGKIKLKIKPKLKK